MKALEAEINAIWDNRALLAESAGKDAVRAAVDALDKGLLRVAEPDGDNFTPEGERVWKVNEWVKKSVLLYFSVAEMQLTELPPYEYYDKIPLKKGLREAGVRVVPPGVARYGSFLEKGAVMMPSYVNIGARVGAGTMVDTWATVGSCAQVGAHVHLSGGVGLGGVLEPLTARPVIIEDECFIGSRCIVVEGMHVGEGAVLGAGLCLTGSTHIIDVSGQTEKTYKGWIPPRSVVIPGSLPKTFAAGTYGVPCALIIGKRKASTDSKTELNETLRDFNVAV